MNKITSLKLLHSVWAGKRFLDMKELYDEYGNSVRTCIRLQSLLVHVILLRQLRTQRLEELVEREVKKGGWFKDVDWVCIVSLTRLFRVYLVVDHPFNSPIPACMTNLVVLMSLKETFSF